MDYLLEISKNRRYILANSDSIQDQLLKLKVRDAVLEIMPDMLQEAPVVIMGRIISVLIFVMVEKNGMYPDWRSIMEKILI